MEEYSNETQAPKKSQAQVWDVMGVMISILIIFLLAFILIQNYSVSDKVSSQVAVIAQIRDAMVMMEKPKAEVIEKIEYVVEKTFVEYFAERRNNESVVRIEGVPAGFENIYQIQVDNCQADLSEACESTFYIYARPNWAATEGTQPFYFSEGQGSKSGQFFGPYMDDVRRLMQEARKIKTMID